MVQLKLEAYALNLGFQLKLESSLRSFQRRCEQHNHIAKRAPLYLRYNKTDHIQMLLSA